MKKMLEKAFPLVWTRETSAFPNEWSKENPACGQCLPTSWIARHYLGGKVVQAVFSDRRIVHFWNVLPCGKEMDFTESQFQGEIIPWHLAHIDVLTPELFATYYELFPGARSRYDLFESRFKIHVLQTV